MTVEAECGRALLLQCAVGRADGLRAKSMLPVLPQTNKITNISCVARRTEEYDGWRQIPVGDCTGDVHDLDSSDVPK